MRGSPNSAGSVSWVILATLSICLAAATRNVGEVLLVSAEACEPLKPSGSPGRVITWWTQGPRGDFGYPPGLKV